MSITFYARGDSSTANNNVINVENLNKVPVTELTFNVDNFNTVLSGGSSGVDMYVGSDPTPHSFTVEFFGNIQQDKSFTDVGGQDIQGAQLAVITDSTTGQRYFFLTDPHLDTPMVLTDFSNGAVNLDNVVYICFLRGTLIETARGPKPVEDLVAGDLVVTDAGPLPVAWTGAHVLGAAELSRQPHLAPIRIAAHAFGPGRPAAPLGLSPDHRVVIEGADVEMALGTPRAFCAAKFLVGRPGITQDTPAGAVEYFHVLFTSHRILTANGLECESLSHGPRARVALGPALCARLVAEGVLGADEGRAPLPVMRRPEALALS